MCYKYLAYIYVSCMPDTQRDQKQALDPLGLELWTQVNMWVLGTKPIP